MTTDKFENVTIVKMANIYFNGKVTSRNILFQDGTHKTLGVMLPGDYEFGTGDRELMEILNGELEVMLPSKNEAATFVLGQSFEVSSNSRFKVKLKFSVDYCCSYG
ncbi:MAG: hypothetical protein A2X25_04190 [Chloroflexi bacterium GWB2_49_20]|nr:MAG: hypothetical protein A2X25_04190 [Chloroflexi bacterium GWB2_49_20]OGN77892.1 MAG: hypothetical protein A2X26_02020 [Chloroflexi bacterium GWC2_49_37]OGN82727.1 MAG: hypothetical protein A2X27_09010 [Chloroflexi bacterium GWD2_49_16]HCM96121.1 hypothetical protein [Anaerolineae bacterium]